MQVVILNDTRPDLHHGCSRVMRVLEQGLTARGLTVSARSPLRHDWASDDRVLSAIAKADLIVINGEGTLHHGARHGETLLSVVDHPAARGRPVALVNALYQDNPPGWGGLLSRMALVAARDSRSAAQMGQAMGAGAVRWVPDLTLAEPIEEAGEAGEANDILWGDSVKPEIAEILAAHATARTEPLLPSLSSLKRPKGRTMLGRALRDIWIRRHASACRRRHPTLTLAPDEAAYSRRIAAARLHVTGRFHGVCYSMAAGRPFLALASNSWKIAALIEDAGLAPWRICSPDQLDPLIARGAAALDYTQAERAALHRFLDCAVRESGHLLDDLARLARRVGPV
ncbi:polysaccharide pyruvyl transferase family protein [Paracoccus salsus]|uniref:polysaccharide pyruvyl transferase family protein n=1 Tax=Paracoccus salsus TaxID=2911061 RepID=UPI001F254937|nr:polysaccharide pyruvyl transferase family protein [Paracoccus salsus]MCF3972637.1 polysaccharide pyruvyl transferase family protein [Paracoccus salsus]